MHLYLNPGLIIKKLLANMKKQSSCINQSDLTELADLPIVKKEKVIYVLIKISAFIIFLCTKSKW